MNEVDDRISLSEDDYIRERYDTHTRFLVRLNDGSEMISDDDRPGYIPHSWLRLKNYCYGRGLYVENMRLQFRSHVEPVGENADGYYFCHSAGGFLFGPTFQYFIVGVLNDGVLRVRKWKVPELLVEFEEERDPTTEDNQHCLITKPGLFLPEKNALLLST